ncbi:hypothetical protein L596_013721 [Steinernema carpocapsae]|uniref:Uncharacterized protein n=1 Tax=Steinernema carpocapsae TaxID=34508 RepID=A0A4U5P154_STECR|nr:hypothetical protein L596_013721 [Steinernema carpocapsae]
MRWRTYNKLKKAAVATNLNSNRLNKTARTGGIKWISVASLRKHSSTRGLILPSAKIVNLTIPPLCLS